MGESVRLTKDRLSQGQEVWKVDFGATHLVGTEELPSFPFPLGKSWGSSPPSQPPKQEGDIFMSFMAKPQPQMNRSVFFLLACTQATKYYRRKSHCRGDELHPNLGSPVPHGTKGWLKIYSLSLVNSQSYQLLSTASNLPHSPDPSDVLHTSRH